MNNTVANNTTDGGILDQLPKDASAAQVWTHWIDGKITGLGEAVHEAASKYGPKAEALILGYAKVDALVHILHGFMWLVLLLIPFIFFTRVYQINSRAASKHGWTEGREDDPTIYCVAAVLGAGGAFFSFFFVLGAVYEVCNFWNWVGLFSPELYLAHQGMVAIQHHLAQSGAQ